MAVERADACLDDVAHVVDVLALLALEKALDELGEDAVGRQELYLSCSKKECIVRILHRIASYRIELHCIVL